MDASMLIDKNRITPSVLYAQCRSCFGYIKFFVSSFERIVLMLSLRCLRPCAYVSLKNIINKEISLSQRQIERFQIGVVIS